MTMRTIIAIGLATLGVALAVTPERADAQRRGFRGGQWASIRPNVPYDGLFTFARIRYRELESTGWSFDYPDTEENFATILTEITSIRPFMDGGNVFDFDDPELLKYPIAYVSEPGFWYPTQSEAQGLRDYLARGGFVIFDDFNYDREWGVFERGLRMALPEAKIFPMTAQHPIFDSFFHIKSLDMTYPNRPSLMAEFYGVFEDNDPQKRLMIIINYNNDIGDYIEWSGQGVHPINLTNDAYKFAVNYIVYGMTR
jgi:hypothetical protein